MRYSLQNTTYSNVNVLYNSIQPSDLSLFSQRTEQYRYGFNGKEKDDETNVGGGSYDFGDRMYDSRLGRWLSIDAHASKYTAISPYVFALNSPLLFKDIDGNDAVVTVQKDPNGGGKITISSTIYITGEGASSFNAREFTSQAARIYKPSIYVNENNEKFEIVFDVKFEYAPDKAKITLQDGDNILEYNKNDAIISNVKGYTTSNTLENEKTGEVTIVSKTKFSGNKGEIAKSDNIGKSFKATLHEVLHFLGLSDRYKEGKDTDGNRETTPNPGYEDDMMATPNTTIKINQTHYNNYGKEYSNKESGKYIQKKTIDVNESGTPIGEAIKPEEQK